MVKKIFLTILTIFVFNSVQCFAEQYKQIDLKTAIEIAQKNNLDIKVSNMDVDIAKNEIKISNRLQNPALKTTWNFGKAGRGNPNQIGLVQTIELGKRTPRKNLAKINYKQAKDEFEQQNFALKMDVAEAYVKLVVAKSILKKYESQQHFLEDLLDISNRNSTAKNKLDLHNIEARIELNQIITQVNKAKTNAKIARIEFNKIINALEENYDTPDDELSIGINIKGLNIPSVSTELPSFKQIEDSAIKNRFDIKIAENQIKIANKELSVVVRQRIPDIEISSGYGYQLAGMSDDGVYKSGAYLEACLVNIPLLYAYKPEIQNAKLKVEKAKTNYISTINKAKKNVEMAYENFVTAQLNLNSYNDKILKDSEELFILFEKSYKIQKFDFATLAAVEETYQDLVEGYSETLSDYYVSWINFLREINAEDFSFEKEKL